MRVGVIGPVFPDSMADNILHALPDLGVKPVSLGSVGPAAKSRLLRRGLHVLRNAVSEGERLAQQGLTRRARDHNCDVIVNVEQSLLPETLCALRKGRTRTALWFPDAVSNIGRSTMFAAAYDALFIKDPLFVARLRDVYGLSVHYLPEACNPNWHKPVGGAGSEPHIAVVGNVYPTRAALLLKLVEVGIPLRLYGGPFPRWFAPGPLAQMHVGHEVVRSDKARVFRQARGVLNNLHPAEMASVNCRLFEATASGAAVLCERRPALPDLYDDDKEVLGFNSFNELVDRCRALLADAAMTVRIGDAASKRAHADHTYQQRLRRLLELVA